LKFLNGLFGELGPGLGLLELGGEGLDLLLVVSLALVRLLFSHLEGVIKIMIYSTRWQMAML
jgi:hypothetical protein